MIPEAEKPCACRAYSASVCARLQHGLKPWTNKAANRVENCRCMCHMCVCHECGKSGEQRGPFMFAPLRWWEYGWGHFGCWLAHQLDRLWTGDCTPCKRCGSGTYGFYE